jgi:hypothetical protein
MWFVNTSGGRLVHESPSVDRQNRGSGGEFRGSGGEFRGSGGEFRGSSRRADGDHAVDGAHVSDGGRDFTTADVSRRRGAAADVTSGNVYVDHPAGDMISSSSRRRGEGGGVSGVSFRGDDVRSDIEAHSPREIGIGGRRAGGSPRDALDNSSSSAEHAQFSTRRRRAVSARQPHRVHTGSENAVGGSQLNLSSPSGAALNDTWGESPLSGSFQASNDSIHEGGGGSYDVGLPEADLGVRSDGDSSGMVVQVSRRRRTRVNATEGI